jgi:hypothetical protein
VDEVAEGETGESFTLLHITRLTPRVLAKLREHALEDYKSLAGQVGSQGCVRRRGTYGKRAAQCGTLLKHLCALASVLQHDGSLCTC